MTKGTNQNTRNTIQSDILNQLKWEGQYIEPGQKIQYIVNDYSKKISNRAVPIILTNSDVCYDKHRYSELLNKCCKSIIEPFE